MKLFNRAVIFLFFLAHSFTFQPSRAATEPTPLRVTFIDVGQGDSILLRDGTGFDVLIDGGKKSAGETVLAYLRQTGVDDRCRSPGLADDHLASHHRLSS